MTDDARKPPELRARRIHRADGSKILELWCEWCESPHFYREEETKGDMRVACHHALCSPYHKTGYRVGAIVDAPAAFAERPFPSAPSVGIRRFLRSIEFSIARLRRGVLSAIFPRPRRGDIFLARIGDTEVSVFGTKWEFDRDNGEKHSGAELLGLISRVFGISSGVAGVRILEAATGAQFGALDRLEIAGAIDASFHRASKKLKGRAK